MSNRIPHLPRLGRRGLLLGLSASALLGGARLALASTPPTTGRADARLVIVLMRGALDGLSAVPAYGDPDFAAHRGELGLPQPGQEGGLLDLGGFFGLHPVMTRMHGFYTANEATILHAVAGPYRTRSHFDAQDLMESGASERLSSGWLNRALGGLPVAPGNAGARTGLAVGEDLPLLMRGDQRVSMYAPPRNLMPDPDLYARLADLAHDDPLLGPALTEGLRTRGFSKGLLEPEMQRGGGFARLAAVAGRLLAAPSGPRVAALEIGGWDTHSGQNNRLRGPLGQLDEGLGNLRTELGDAWKHTAVLVMTEFGRTVRVNGNAGTDHGTGTVAFLVGGAVAGGKVLTDWPGLAQSKLFENRDLQPTMDLREVAKGLLRDHLKLSPAAVAAAFPESGSIAVRDKLLRA
jgi:uncharacterized protein (DUF1501 family)